MRWWPYNKSFCSLVLVLCHLHKPRIQHRYETFLQRSHYHAFSKTAASLLVWQISSTAWIIRRYLGIFPSGKRWIRDTVQEWVFVLQGMLLFFTLAITPSNGRGCWSTVRCLIRSIYLLISFSLYPDPIYPSLEANFSSQELPLFAATWTFHDLDQTTSSASDPILLTSG